MKAIRYIGILVLSFALSGQVLATKPASSRIEKMVRIYTDVLRQLDLTYADTLNYEKLVQTSIDAMLRQLDPYTIYYPEEKTDIFKQMTTGKYGGIGSIITISPKGWNKESGVVISEPYEGKPAQKAGLQAGDLILEIDGKKALGKSTSDVSSMLKGRPGTTITLLVQRYGEKKPLEISFKREEISLNPVAYSALLTAEDGKKEAYIIFSEFTENSAKIFTDTLSSLIKQGAERLILDLRGNGGGSVSEAVQIMSLFIPQGTEVITMKGRTASGTRTYRTPSKPLYPELPIAIIVDGQSASASEILAGAMQDLDRATIYGSNTFGKGLVQNIREIAYDGILKVTTSKYYIPSGRCVQAIQYNHDGSASRVPDSLTHEFKTKKGRVVRDGGGIRPDVDLTDSNKVNITYPLVRENLIFEYAVRFHAAHPTIAPAEAFEVSDSVINDFVRFLEEKEFQYQTETSKYLADLMRMTQYEDLDSTVLTSLKEIEKEINPSLEKAVWKHVEDIRQWLGDAIVTQYYYQKGSNTYLLRYDKTLRRVREHIIEDGLTL